MSIERSFFRQRNRLAKLFGRKSEERSEREKKRTPIRQNKVFFEPLEPRLLLDATGLDKPLLVIPGFGGTMPAAETEAGLEEWLTHRGIAPDKLRVDPLANVYDNLIETLEDVGYVEGQTLFVANWDWRVPVAPQDGTQNGNLSNVSAEDITDTIYETGLDYLGYWLKQAQEAWSATHEEPLTSVDIIAHSTGGLVARSYIQSEAYGDPYDSNANGIIDPTDSLLPVIEDLVLVGVPNQGSGDIWTILHDDFNSSIATRGAGIIVHSAWDLAEQGEQIYNPDDTPMVFTDHESFIAKYIGAGPDLVPIFRFLDSNLDRTYEVPAGENENTLLLDLNDAGPSAFVSKLTGDLTVVFGTNEDTIIGVAQHIGPTLSLLPVVQNFDELLGHNPRPGETWYVENELPLGDGTVPRDSAVWQLVEGENIHLAEQTGVSHRGLVSELSSQKAILNAVGLSGYTDDEIAVDPNGGDSGLMQLATQLFNEAGILDALATGVQGLFNNLQEGFNTIFGGLPVIGQAFVDRAGTFFSDFGDSFADLVALGPGGIVLAAQEGIFSVLGPVLQDINGDGQVNSDDVAIGLVDGALEFRVQLGGEIAGTSVDIGFDVGLDALGLELAVNGGIDLSVEWELDLGFGVILAGPSFYVVCDQGNEAELRAKASLQDGTTLSGELGFLQLTAKDIADPDDIDDPLNPNDIPNPDGHTGLYGSLGIDLRDPGFYGLPDLTPGRLTFAEMNNMVPDQDLGLRKMVAGTVNAGADVNLHLVTGFGGSAVFPSIRADLDIDWDFLSVDTSAGPEEGMFSSESPIIAFNDVTLDLGSFITDLVAPVLRTINDVLDPIMPLVDALRAPVPVITELGEYLGGLGLNYIDPLADRNPGVSIYDMAKAIVNIKPVPQLAFVLAVLDVIDIVHDVSSLAADGEIELGSFQIGSSSDGQDIREATDLSAFGRSNEQLGNPESQLDAPGSMGTKSFLKKALSTANRVLEFPILTDPMQAFKLLMGQDADLIKLNIPALDFEFRFGQGIPIFPPFLTANLGGTFRAYADLDFGFDTYGIRKYKASGDFADIFDGFYVDDHVAGGVDSPEATFTAGLNAGASVSGVLVAAEVAGGINGTVSADLVDIDPDGTFTQYAPDGKIRPSEIAQLLSHSPFAFFNLSGRVDYYFHAWVGVGIIVDLGLFEIEETVYENTWNLASGTLVEFKLETPFPPQNPVLGAIENGDLILNMGTRAGNRLYGNTTDGDENFSVSYQPANLTNADPNDNQDLILVSAMGGVQSFSAAGIARIVGYGGQGNDTITVAQNIPDTIKVLLRGGAGNDTLKAFGGDAADGGGSGSEHAGLFGEEGNDLLQGGPNGDTLDGGAGNDRLLGGGGNDDVYGGAGSDYLRGDAGDDVIRGDAEDLGLYGGAGLDSIYVSGGGVNVRRVPVEGGSGDDTIVAEYANLDISGGYGQNSLLLRHDGGDGALNMTLVRDPVRGDAGTLQATRDSNMEWITFTGINTSLGVQLGGVANNLAVKSTLDVPLTINGGAGDDSISIETLQAETIVDLAGAGTDTVAIGSVVPLQLLEHSLTAKGGSESGADRLVYDIGSDPSDHSGAQALAVDAPGAAGGFYTVSGLPLAPGIHIDYDGQVEVVELLLGAGDDEVGVPVLARDVVIRGAGGADRAEANLENGAPVGSLTTYEVETVLLSDGRTGINPDWLLDQSGLQADGQLVLATQGALASHVFMNGGDDNIIVSAIEHETHINTGGGSDAVQVGNNLTPGFDSDIGATLFLEAGNSGGGGDSLIISDRSRENSAEGTLGAGRITGFTMGTSSVNYAGFEKLVFLGSDLEGQEGGYNLTVAGTDADTTLALGANADIVVVANTSHATLIQSGSGGDEITVVAAGAALTVQAGEGGDELIYAPPAGAAENLIMTNGTGGNQGRIDSGGPGPVEFAGMEQITFDLPGSNDGIRLNYDFTVENLQINGNRGNDTVTIQQIGGPAAGSVKFADGSGADRLILDMAGGQPTSFANVSMEAGLDLLAIDNSTNPSAAAWVAAAGGIFVEEAPGVRQLIINSEGAKETKILAGNSGGDTLTIEELATRDVEATIESDRVELISGAQILSPASIINSGYRATYGTLLGVADVASFGDFVYAACAGDDTVSVFRRGQNDELELVQVFKDGFEGMESLNGVSAVVVSNDGRFVCVSAPLENAISVFARDAATGKLALLQVVRDGQESLTAGVENGSFETGDFSGWSTLGAAFIETAGLGMGPTDGTYQSLLTTGAGSVPYASLGNLLPGLNLGSQVLFAENFDDGNYNGWRVVSQTGATPNWTVSSGQLRESSNLYGPNASATSNRQGTYVYYEQGTGWTDYELSADLYCGDNDGIGLIFRYQDNANYYKLELDEQRGFRKLFKVKDGVETTLWSQSPSDVYPTWSWYGLAIRVTTEPGGARIRAWIDVGNNENWAGLFEVVDSSPVTQGTVAMYSWGMGTEYNTNLGGAWFDNIQVRQPFATEGSAIRQTVTVAAGTELSFQWNFLTNPHTTYDRWWYRDFAFVSIAGETNTLADIFDASIASPTGYDYETGIATFRHVFSQGGTFDVAIGVVDVGDTTADSGLVIDNVRYTVPAADGLAGVTELALAGDTLYAAGGGDDALAVFTCLADGRLAFREAIRNAPSVNVALGKDATQSSNYLDWWFVTADRAIDGNKDAVFHFNDWANSISHTGDCANSWWEVDLGGFSNLDHLQLYDRYGFPGQLSNFYVIVYDGTTEVFRQHVQRVSSGGGGSLRLDLPEGTVGNRVRLQLNGLNLDGNGSLVMTECEVFDREVRGLTDINSLTLSGDGTRLYATSSSGSIAVFARKPSGDLAFVDDLNSGQNLNSGTSDAAEAVVNGRRVLYTLSQGGSTLQAFDVSPGIAGEPGYSFVLEIDPAIGALRAIETAADQGTIPEIYVLGEDGIGLFEPDPASYSLVALDTAALSCSGPAEFHVAGDKVYVADTGSNALRLLAIAPWKMSTATSWTTTLTTLEPRNSPAPVTSVTDIPGGVKLTYAASTGGSGVGTQTVRYDFTTTATATGRIALDITYSAFHAWHDIDYGLALLHNGVVVPGLSASWPDWEADFFDNVTLDVNEGDTYGIRVTAGNYDAGYGVWGEVTLVGDDGPPQFGAETETTAENAEFPLDIELSGLQSVAVSPDGLFAYAVDPVFGALVALNIGDPGALLFGSAYATESHDAAGFPISGLQGARDVVLNPIYNELYVLSADEPAITVFERNPDGALIFGQRVTIGAGATGVAVSPDGGTVYTTGPSGMSSWSRQPDGSLSTTPIVHGLAGANDWIIQTAIQSTGGTFLFLTSESLGAARIVEDADGSIIPLQDIPSIGNPSDLALSPNGHYLFVTDADNNSLSIFERATDGSYSPLQAFREGEAGMRGLRGANAVAVSPSGENVYVTAEQSDTLTVFRFNATKGLFEFAQILRNSLGLKSPNSVAVDPASGRVFVGSSEGMGLNDGGVTGFNVAGGAPTGALFTVSFSGIEGLNLTTADGDDTIRLVTNPEGVTQTNIDTDGGQDSVLLAQFGGNTTVNTGIGGDTVDIRPGREDARLVVNTGEGADSISLGGTASGDAITIYAGSDDDAVRVGGGRLAADVPEILPSVKVYGEDPAETPEGETGDTLLFDAGSPAAPQKTGDGLSGTIVMPGRGAVEYASIRLREIALSAPDAGIYADINEGNGITLDASGTIEALGRAVSYSWDIDGDGIYADRIGKTVGLTWSDLVDLGLGDDGQYIVSVRVTDVSNPTGDPVQDSLINEFTDAFTTITILNTAPEVADPPAAALRVGQEYTVQLSTFGDPGEDAVSGWTIAWGDGVTEALGSDASEARHRYITTGEFGITLTATDEDGSYSKSGSINITAPAPAISKADTTGPLSIREGQGITLQATAPGLASFAWNLDGVDQGSDGDLFDDAMGAVVDLTWQEFLALGIDDSGTYGVTVQVSYDDYNGGGNHTNTATASLTIENVAPTANLSSSTQSTGSPILEGGAATVSFSSQKDASPADESFGFLYSYDFGDDGAFEIQNSPLAGVQIPEEFLADDGILPVRGVIADKDGGASEYVTSVAIRNAAPALTGLAATPVFENDSTTLTGQIADAGIADTFTVSVDWGDGSVDTFNYGAGTTSFSETHKYSDDLAGSDSEGYAIQVKAEDDDGGIDAVQTLVKVANLPPVLADLSVTPALSEGGTAALGGRIVDSGALDTFALTVDWGDGSVAETRVFAAGTTDFSLAHNYADDGVYNVSVALQDDDGGMDEPDTALSVTVGNVAPTLSAVSVTSANENGIAYLSGEIGDPGQRDTFTSVVDWGDGSPVETFIYGAGTTGISQAHRYLDDGSYTVSAAVQDNSGQEDTATTTAFVGNVAPELTTYFPVVEGEEVVKNETITVNEGEAFTLAGTIFEVGTEDSFTVSVDWGDGSAIETQEYGAGASGFALSHRYLDPPTGTTSGPYAVSVSLEDDDGAVATQSRVVTVNDVAPTLELGGAANVNEGSPYTLTLGAVTDPGDDTVSGYTVHWGDGMSAVYTSAGEVTHTYADGQSSPTITVDLIDEDGPHTAAGSLSLTVNNVAAAVDAGADAAIEEGGTFAGTGSYVDPGADTWTATVNYGDGSGVKPLALNPDMTFVLSHVYADNGSYAVTVTVNDDDSGEGADTLTVNVNNVAPTLTISGEAEAEEGSTYTLNLSSSDPGADTISGWTITWDDGNIETITGNPSAVIHVYADGTNNYEIAAAATDEDGTYAAGQTVNVTVNNVAPENPVIAGPTTGDEGSELTLSGSSSDPGIDMLTYAWGVTKGGGAYTTGSGTTFSFTPDDNETYVVTLTVNDGDGGASLTERTVTVSNVAPIADAGPDQTISEGDAVSLSGSFTDPGSADSHSYVWSVIASNGQVIPGGTDPVFSFTPYDEGAYTALLMVTDDDGAWTSDSLTVTANNVSPENLDISGPTTGDEGSELTFTGSANDPGADPLTYGWNVHKGGNAYASGSGASFSFTPDDNGNYRITLTVGDEDGGSSVTEQAITVANVAPTVNAASDATIEEGRSFIRTGSFVDPGADAWSATVDYGDGSEVQPLTLTSDKSFDLSHIYGDNGVYTVTVTVNDDDSGAGADTLTLTIINAAPAVDAGADQTVDEGATVTFAGSIADLGTSDTHTIQWAFGDGEATTGALTPTHVYADNGEYTVTLSVTDDDGAATSDTLTVTVNNISPLLTISGAGETDEGAAYALNLVGSDPGADTISGWAINWGDGSDAQIINGNPSSVTHVYADGTISHVISATAADEDGVYAAGNTVGVNVKNVAPTLTISGAPEVNEGSSYTLSLAASEPGADTISGWQITWGDGNIENVTGNPSSVTHEYAEGPNSYQISATATDEDGIYAAGNMVDVTVRNVAPQNLSVVGPTSGDEGSSLIFTGSASDPGADPLTYAWDVTKGGNAYTTGSGATFSFTPDDNETYVVTLMVNDDDGGASLTERTVIVANVAPALMISGDAEVEGGSTYTLNLSSNDPGADTISGWAINWGDGSVETVNGNPSSVTHVFAEGPNSHEISATAADEDGTYAAAQTVNVNVTHLPVELQDLAVTPSIDENGIATLTGNIINPDPQDSFTLLVDWGDGSSLQAFSYAAGITAFSETHRYLDDPAGIGSDKFIVTATLADDDGGSDTATAEVMVNNVAPVITSVVSSAPNIGDAAEQQLVTIAGTFGDIGTLDTHVAVINWGDGTTSEAIITESNGSGSISGTHQYADGGIYEVSVALSDDDAGAVTGSATAAIAGVGVKDGVLFIIGTHGDDHLLINRDSEGIKIHADFLPDYGHIRTVAPDGIQRVEVLLGDGTDHATIAGDIGISILMDGGAGDDHLKGGLGADVLRGGAGDDVLIGGGGNDTLDGGEGHDILLGGDGEDILLGGAGNDILVGGSGNDHLDGGAGNDMLLGGSGNDSLIGGDGEDLTVGGAGNDVIDGGAANDVLSGGSGEDSLYGGEGNDVLFGGSNDDSLAGGEENDILSGGSGDDTLEGDAGNDVLLGDAGEDALTGGDGNDILIGGAGNDTLAGGAGTNILIENSPSWVRQFVTNLASYGLDPNGDISIEISAALDPQLPCA